MVNRMLEQFICDFVAVLLIKNQFPPFTSQISGGECRADLFTQGERSP